MDWTRVCLSRAWCAWLCARAAQVSLESELFSLFSRELKIRKEGYIAAFSLQWSRTKENAAKMILTHAIRRIKTQVLAYKMVHFAFLVLLAYSLINALNCAFFF